jgi:hypothetical protein
MNYEEFQQFQVDINRDIEVRQIARQVLDVDESVSDEELKRAWRNKCLEHHPDRNPDDPESERRFVVVNCAYRLLAEGKSCDMLLDEVKSETLVSPDGKYNLNNAWGLFLWWRDKFSMY